MMHAGEVLRDAVMSMKAGQDRQFPVLPEFYIRVHRLKDGSFAVIGNKRALCPTVANVLECIRSEMIAEVARQTRDARKLIDDLKDFWGISILIFED